MLVDSKTWATDTNMLSVLIQKNILAKYRSLTCHIDFYQSLNSAYHRQHVEQKIYETGDYVNGINYSICF